jgi:cytochrome c oxidase subunit III
VKTRIAQDLSSTTTQGFGHQVVPYWGTLGFMLIEGMGFVLAIAIFLYIVAVDPQWPIGYPQQDLLAPTSLTVLLILSLLPNWLVMKRAKAKDNATLRPLLILMSFIALFSLVLRAFEFARLGIHWQTNVYGSLLWTLLGLHTTHLLTDAVDTWVMTALFFTKHSPDGRFSDAYENAMYWIFVVVGWLPIYGLLYWSNRIGVQQCAAGS